jgi:hypothetical protein
MNSTQSEKIIVSLTTISQRIHNIHKVILSLLNQSYQNLDVYLYLSEEPYLLDEGIKELPFKLLELKNDDKRFKINFVRNTGPYRKLIPVLSEYWGSSQQIITVDDDVRYPPDAIATLVLAERIYSCPVAFRGRRAVLKKDGLALYNCWLKTGQAGRAILNVPTGKDGVIYRPSYFKRNVLDVSKAMQLAKTTDDLWFKWHTALNGYPSTLLFDSLEESFDSVGLPNETSSLFCSFNEHGSNDTVIANLETFFSMQKGFCFKDVVKNEREF